MTSARRPAYFDPDKNIRWDTNEADREGLLSKKSKWIGEWRERYFILKGAKLFFTKKASDAPHGMIDLIDCQSVASTSMSFKYYTFEVTMRGEKQEKFILSAPSQEAKDSWMAAMNQAMAKANSAHYVE
jgi:hypothetical protein